MPLSCDCYPGCWGDHASNWSSIAIPEELLALGRERRDWHALRYGNYGDGYLIWAAKLPLGEYVVMNNRIHVERAEHLDALNAVVAQMRADESPAAWHDRTAAAKRETDNAYWAARGPATYVATPAPGARHATYEAVG